MDPMPDQNPVHVPPRIGVVTVTYASASVLATLIHSLTAATSSNVELVVVDNKPGVDDAEAIAGRAGATYLPCPDNPGYGGGMNRGIQALDPGIEWILVVNPDVVLDPGAIDNLLARALDDPRIGAVGPRIVTDGATYPSGRRIPSLRTGIGHALFANVWKSNPWSAAYHSDEADPPRVRDVGWLSGACVLLRRSAYDEVGGFDESYFMYFEDVDLCYRMGLRGYRNVYEPAASIEHHGGHSTQGASVAMIAAHHRSARLFLDRKYPGLVLLPLRLALHVGLRIRSWHEQRRAVTRSNRPTTVSPESAPPCAP